MPDQTNLPVAARAGFSTSDPPAPLDALGAGQLAPSAPRRAGSHFSSAPAGGRDVDAISRPAHYLGAGGLEAIHVIADWGLGFELGNVVKYVLRHAAKAEPLADLRKARQYVTFAADRLDRTNMLPDWTIDGPCLIHAAGVTVAFRLAPALAEAITAVRIAVEVPALTRAQLANCARCLDVAIAELSTGEVA